jgi:hypothetical protein
VGAPVILKYLTRVGIQAGKVNLYGPTPLAACQVCTHTKASQGL